MKNLRIGVRLGLAFGVMVLLIVSLTTIAYIQIGKLDEQAKKLAKSNIPKLTTTFAIQDAIQNVTKDALLVVAIEDPVFRVKTKESIEKDRAQYHDNLKKLEELEHYPEGKALIEKMKQSIKALADANNKGMELAMAGKQADADKMLVTTPLLLEQLEKVFEEMTAFQMKRAAARAKAADDAHETALIELFVTGAIAILIAIVFAVLITRGITGPLGKMRDMIQDIAQGEGDLTKRLNADSKDELGEVSRWFNTFVDKLHGIINKVSETTNLVASASTQLNATAQLMATGSEEVTAQVGTVATAGEEMSATSGDIAQNCQFAAEGSRQASTAAVSGAKVVDETIAVMNSIAGLVRNSAKAVESLGNRSDQIGAIVGTIEDIADQTNLLALNAAIEAARAGEQGRGFAVVADEVRALAERTTRATREIGEMIKAIQQETKGAVIAMEEGVNAVAKGSETAANSGRALEEILEQINSVTSQINQVATAAEEQTATTSEISNNMQQITAAVNQTASGAQESAVAADQLSALAGDLRLIVGQFRLA